MAERCIESEFALGLLARHCAVVFGNVIDAGRTFSYSQNGCMRRCINMQGRLCALLVFEPCAWPIQKPIAQHYSFRQAERRLFERNHAVNGAFARTRCGEIERIGFGACTHPWCVNEGDALRNQTPHTGILGCGHQIARSVNAQTRIPFEAFLIL